MTSRAAPPTATSGSPAPAVDPGLPVSLTSFIGREREIATVRELLASSRLLTLTGAGGSGKTRLAVAVAAEWAREREVRWIELATITEPDDLPALLGAAVAAHADGERSTEEALVEQLRDRRILLVLDNCEHLVDACARLADTLLRQCAALHILVTSREPLAIGGERSLLVPVLSLPDASAELTADVALRSEAVRLFVERAQDVAPSFRLTDANAAAVARICRRLDGIPLAIELAAARVRVLSPEQIAERLGDAFRLLTGGSRTALPRHRTLRGTIDWSYDLLTASERTLLCRLAVFAGGFSLEAAEAVCAGPPLEPEDILDGVAALVDKSLVLMEPGEGVAHYRLLHTVRQYAAERLAAAGELEARRERHARHFLALAEAVAPQLLTRADPGVLARIGAEYDDLRAAAAWAAGDPSRGEAWLRLVDLLHWHAYGTGYWFGTGQFHEARRRLADALARAASADSALRGRALAAVGLLALAQGAYAEARTSLEASLALVRQHGDAAAVSFVLSKLGAVHLMMDDPAGAARLLDESYELVEAMPPRLLRTFVCFWRGWVAHARGDLALARAMGDEALHVAGLLAHRTMFAHASTLLGRIEYAQGRYGTAFVQLRDAAEAHREVGNGWGLALDLQGMVGLAVARARYDDAARLLGASDALRERIGCVLPASERAECERLLATTRQRCGAEYERLHAEGSALPIDDVVRLLADDAGAHTAEYPVHAPGDPPPPQPATGASVPGAGRALRLRVRALGPLEIWCDGALLGAETWRAAKPRELFLYLLSYPEGRTREQIGLAFWPDASAAQVKNNFHVTLHHLRRALGRTEWIVFDDDRYQVDWAPGVEFDARTFEAEATAALKALRERKGGPRVEPGTGREDMVARLREALALYCGDFLADQAAGDWHLEPRDRLRRLFADGLRVLGVRLEEAGDLGAAADAHRRLILAEELDEEGHRRLMRCLARMGSRGEALRVYERLATLLRTDLDAAPEPETVTLHDRIRRGEPL